MFENPPSMKYLEARSILQSYFEILCKVDHN